MVICFEPRLDRLVTVDGDPELDAVMENFPSIVTGICEPQRPHVDVLIFGDACGTVGKRFASQI